MNTNTVLRTLKSSILPQLTLMASAVTLLGSLAPAAMAQPALNNLNIGPTLRTNSPSSVAPSTDLSASPLPPSINTLGVNCLNHADQASGPQSFVILNCEGISLGGSDFILDPAPVQASNLRFRRSVQDLTQPDRSHPDTGNLLTKTGELQFLF